MRILLYAKEKCEISQKNELTIFYLDSENTEGKTQLKEFRDEFGIDTVPSIIFFSEDGSFEMINHNITDVSFDKKKLEKGFCFSFSTGDISALNKSLGFHDPPDLNIKKRAVRIILG